MKRKVALVLEIEADSDKEAEDKAKVWLQEVHIDELPEDTVDIYIREDNG